MYQKGKCIYSMSNLETYPTEILAQEICQGYFWQHCFLIIKNVKESKYLLIAYR